MKDLVITDVSQFVLLFPSLLDETLRLYEDDKLFLAHKAVQKMRNSLAHHQAAVDAYTAEVQVGLKGIEMEMEKHSKRMQTIVKEANEVLQLIEELEDDQGWSLVSQHEDGNVQVFYRNENSTPVHSIKMQGIIDSPALNLMAVMNEHTLYDTWIPLLREVQLVKHISRYRKVIYLSAYLPWPISSRDALLYGYGVDNLEEDRAVIMIRSVGEGDLEPALVPPVKSHVRVDIHSTGVLIQPISQARTRVVMMTNVDPKVLYQQILKIIAIILLRLLFSWRTCLIHCSIGPQKCSHTRCGRPWHGTRIKLRAANMNG
jgi:hypothetical protein